MAKIPVLVTGAGSWGTALALVLARNQHPVYLWDNNSTHITKLQNSRRNDVHIPGVPFPDGLQPVVDLLESRGKVKDIVIAVPCSGLPGVLTQLATWQEKNFNICLACKGFAAGDRVLNHEVVEGIMHDRARIAVLSGPSFAGEVARGLPTAVTIASADQATAEHFAACFHNDVFRIYTHDDIIGVQIGGAVKNVMAIAAGISDGLGFGANARAALVTRGLAEITRFGVALGGRQETFMGLAGLGDLVLTCTDDQSRNRRLGLALAQGVKLEDAVRRIGQAIEGINTAAEVIKIAAKYTIEMPIVEQVQQVLCGKVTPKAAVHNLLSRMPRTELD
jgi:glycerol-3-phosphate dehydrogenase (NAD(P)+)